MRAFLFGKIGGLGCAGASSAMVDCERAKSIRKEELKFVARLQGVNARKVCG